MIIDYSFTEFQIQAEVMSEHDERLSVVVTRGRSDFDHLKMKPVEIRWSAYGSVDVETAAIYINLLRKAIEIADQLSRAIQEFKIYCGIQGPDLVWREYSGYRIAPNIAVLQDKLNSNPELRNVHIEHMRELE